MFLATMSACLTHAVVLNVLYFSERARGSVGHFESEFSTVVMSFLRGPSTGIRVVEF